MEALAAACPESIEEKDMASEKPRVQMGALLSIQPGRMRTINCIIAAAVISAIGKCVTKGWRTATDYCLVAATKSRKESFEECLYRKEVSLSILEPSTTQENSTKSSMELGASERNFNLSAHPRPENIRMILGPILNCIPPVIETSSS
jgi:hypothetical protein